MGLPATEGRDMRERGKAPDETADSAGEGSPSRSDPLRAFALGAVCVSALALAFSLGRHWPLKPQAEKQPEILPTLAEVRRRPAVAFDQLEIDRGTAASEDLSPGSGGTR